MDEYFEAFCDKDVAIRSIQIRACTNKRPRKLDNDMYCIGRCYIATADVAAKHGWPWEHVARSS